MGLHKVSAFIREKYNHLLRQEHLSLFAHERVFVDITSFLFKYVCINGSESSVWINSFISLMLCFRKNGVYVVPVFDGKAPDAKAGEQQQRRDARAKSKERTQLLKDALDSYENGDYSEEVVSLLMKEKQALEKRDKLPSLLHPANEEITPKDIKQLHAVVQSLQRQNSFLTPEDHQFLRKLLSSVGVKWIQAPGESEAYCCWLVRNGYGSAVVSIDTDCIAHRADIIIQDIDKNTGNITYINTAELLAEWKLSPEQLIDFGILVGCDYNPNSRVNGIGPSKAIQLLQKHTRIEDIPGLIDTSVLKVEECRRLFNLPFTLDGIDLSAATIDEQAMKECLLQRSGIKVEPLQQLINIHNKHVPIRECL